MAKFATVRDLKNQTTSLIREAERGKAVVDRFFPRDALYPQNRIFVEKLVSFEAAVSSDIPDRSSPWPSILTMF